MDESEETNRTRKLEAKERARRHRASGRAYLHAMTNSRVRRAKETMEQAEKRQSTESQEPPNG
jgi:hypothetical protein